MVIGTLFLEKLEFHVARGRGVGEVQTWGKNNATYYLNYCKTFKILAKFKNLKFKKRALNKQQNSTRDKKISIDRQNRKHYNNIFCRL
jgi:hypothetical protein